MKHYVNDWAIIEMMRTIMKNSRCASSQGERKGSKKQKKGRIDEYDGEDSEGNRDDMYGDEAPNGEDHHHGGEGGKGGKKKAGIDEHDGEESEVNRQDMGGKESSIDSSKDGSDSDSDKADRRHSGGGKDNSDSDSEDRCDGGDGSGKDSEDKSDVEDQPQHKKRKYHDVQEEVDGEDTDGEVIHRKTRGKLPLQNSNSQGNKPTQTNRRSSRKKN